jgi:hypothetical protein
LPIEHISLEALAGGLSFKTPTWEERKEEELAAFGFILSVHPMAYWGAKHAMPHRVLARDAQQHVGRVVVYYGVLITTKTVKTVRDDLMKFVTFEDESDLIECVMFPEAYEKYGRFLDVLAPYRITGQMTRDFDTCILQVTELARLVCSRHFSQRGPARNCRARWLHLEQMARRTIPISPRWHTPAHSPGIHLLVRRDLLLLLVASRAAFRWSVLARVSPDSPQRQSHRNAHLVLQASIGDCDQFRSFDRNRFCVARGVC